MCPVCVPVCLVCCRVVSRRSVQVAAMEEKLRALHAKTVELETQLQVEARAKRAQQEANKKMANEENNLRNQVAELQAKIEKTESERLRMEAEARDSSEQLREMAEKVFQLLERLKLAELGKTKAVEALRTKESELTALKKKNSRCALSWCCCGPSSRALTPAHV